MRVALLYPEVYDMARFREARKEFPPFGVLYLASAIEQAGHEGVIEAITPDRTPPELHARGAGARRCVRPRPTLACAKRLLAEAMFPLPPRQAAVIPSSRPARARQLSICVRWVRVSLGVSAAVDSWLNLVM